MPVVSSKINQQELDAVAEYANRHGITVSNLIRMLLVREVAAPRILASSVNEIILDESNEKTTEEPRKNSLLNRLAKSNKTIRQEKEGGMYQPTPLELLGHKREQSRLQYLLEQRRLMTEN